MVGAFQKPSSGREPKPIHSIPYSVAQPLERGSNNYYSIIQGETLWGIAWRYGVALTALIAANPQIKNPNLIYPGDQVRIP